jgi:hypothetical protein
MKYIFFIQLCSLTAMLSCGGGNIQPRCPDGHLNCAVNDFDKTNSDNFSDSRGLRSSQLQSNSVGDTQDRGSFSRGNPCTKLTQICPEIEDIDECEMARTMLSDCRQEIDALYWCAIDQEICDDRIFNRCSSEYGAATICVESIQDRDEWSFNEEEMWEDDWNDEWNDDWEEE